MIVALLNQKGGVGKTTLATHIAGELAMRGQHVVLLDADPQGSSLDWTQRRSQQGLPRLFSAVGLARETLHQEAPELARRADHVIIDGPPRIAALARSALLAAERGEPGAVYFLTDGAPLPFRQFLSRLIASQGLTVPDKSLPLGLAYGVATVCETLWDTLRLPGQPPVTRMPVALFGQEITVDDSRARRELGYAPVTTLEAGLARLSPSLSAGCSASARLIND